MERKKDLGAVGALDPEAGVAGDVFVIGYGTNKGAGGVYNLRCTRARFEPLCTKDSK